MPRLCTICGSPLSIHNKATVCFRHREHPNHKAYAIPGKMRFVTLGIQDQTPDNFEPCPLFGENLGIDSYFSLDSGVRLGFVWERDDT